MGAPRLDSTTSLICVEGHGRHVVLELLQLGDELRRQDVAARAGDLPELDEARAEVLEDEARALVDRDAPLLVLALLDLLGRDLRRVGEQGALLGVFSLRRVRPKPARATTSPNPCRTRTLEISRSRTRSRTALRTDTMGPSLSRGPAPRQSCVAPSSPLEPSLASSEASSPPDDEVPDSGTGPVPPAQEFWQSNVNPDWFGSDSHVQRS